MTARFNEANLRAFENARESHAKCTRLIQDLSAWIDRDRLTLRALQDAEIGLAAVLLASPSGDSFPILPSIFYSKH